MPSFSNDDSFHTFSEAQWLWQLMQGLLMDHVPFSDKLSADQRDITDALSVNLPSLEHV